MPGPTIAVINLKGGSTKTTSSAFLLHALHEAGLDVLGVDADPENESLIRWSELGEWDVPVIALPVRDLHKRLAGLAGERAVVIDTPPMEDVKGVVASAVRAATHVVIPMSPTAVEFDRLGAVLELIGDVEPLWQTPPNVSVLLTRVVTSAASGDVYADAIAASVPVLKSRVRRLERFAQAFGQPVHDAANSEYGDAVTELLAVGADQ